MNRMKSAEHQSSGHHSHNITTPVRNPNFTGSSSNGFGLTGNSFNSAYNVTTAAKVM